MLYTYFSLSLLVLHLLWFTASAAHIDLPRTISSLDPLIPPPTKATTLQNLAVTTTRVIRSTTTRYLSSSQKPTVLKGKAAIIAGSVVGGLVFLAFLIIGGKILKEKIQKRKMGESHGEDERNVEGAQGTSHDDSAEKAIPEKPIVTTL